MLGQDASRVTVMRVALRRNDRFCYLLLIERVTVIDRRSFHTRAVLLLVVTNVHMLSGRSFIDRVLPVLMKLTHVLPS